MMNAYLAERPRFQVAAVETKAHASAIKPQSFAIYGLLASVKVNLDPGTQQEHYSSIEGDRELLVDDQRINFQKVAQPVGVKEANGTRQQPVHQVIAAPEKTCVVVHEYLFMKGVVEQEYEGISSQTIIIAV